MLRRMGLGGVYLVTGVLRRITPLRRILTRRYMPRMRDGVTPLRGIRPCWWMPRMGSRVAPNSRVRYVRGGVTLLRSVLRMRRRIATCWCSSMRGVPGSSARTRRTWLRRTRLMHGMRARPASCTCGRGCGRMATMISWSRSSACGCWLMAGVLARRCVRTRSRRRICRLRGRRGVPTIVASI